MDQLNCGQIDWITVTSSAIARSWSAMFGQSLENTRLASISPVNSETLHECGLAPKPGASQYTMADVVAAILDHSS